MMWIVGNEYVYRYAGMTSYWDAALGNVTGLIKKRGMWNDTILVTNNTT